MKTTILLPLSRSFHGYFNLVSIQLKKFYKEMRSALFIFKIPYKSNISFFEFYI